MRTLKRRVQYRSRGVLRRNTRHAYSTNVKYARRGGKLRLSYARFVKSNKTSKNKYRHKTKKRSY